MSKENEIIDAWNLPEDSFKCPFILIHKELDTPEQFNAYYNNKCGKCAANMENPSLTDYIESAERVNPERAASDPIIALTKLFLKMEERRQAAQN